MIGQEKNSTPTAQQRYSTILYGDQSIVYPDRNINQKNAYLKIADRLKNEFKRLAWLQKKLPVPEIIDYLQSPTEVEALLLTKVPGENLAQQCRKKTPLLIVEKVAKVIRVFHETDAHDCPFGTHGANHVLTHGDACLPNIFFV
ncbi:MAG: hypothetical protein IPL87_00830 [Candidatus Moraniibacteriota bacterium]|nr:MAG: hypothetical protein IPL87_00830 [Candidatus Moranbacteria bacterium]